MRNRVLPAACRVSTAGACLMMLLLCVAAVARGAKEMVSPWAAVVEPSQEQSKDKNDKKDKPPTVPEAELKAAQAIEKAADIPAMLAAAGEFMQKYPKSPLRPQVAPLIADRIGRVEDPAQRIAQSESYLKMFNAPGDADLVNPYLLSAYTDANRLDEAFALAATAVDKSPDPVAASINLARAGLMESRNQNLKHAAQSNQLALKAIGLIEGNQKPAAVSDATWANYRTERLPMLYQWVAMLSLAAGDKADAKAKLAKAVALNQFDPINYMLLSTMTNDEYQRLVQEHKAAAAGAAKDELLKKAEAQLDEVIDAYAHAVALTEGNPQYDAMRTGLRADLESYYKYRNKNSTEGLQALIDKYKKR